MTGFNGALTAIILLIIIFALMRTRFYTIVGSLYLWMYGCIRMISLYFIDGKYRNKYPFRSRVKMYLKASMESLKEHLK